MGANLIPVFNPDIPDATPESDTHLALTELDALDEAAQLSGLKPLSLFLNDGESGESGVLWHSTQEGLATVRGLRAALGEESGFDGEDREILLEELSDLEQCLEKGEKRNAKFCFIAA